MVGVPESVGFAGLAIVRRAGFSAARPHGGNIVFDTGVQVVWWVPKMEIVEKRALFPDICFLAPSSGGRSFRALFLLDGVLTMCQHSRA